MGLDEEIIELQSYFGVDFEDLYELEDSYSMEDSDGQLMSEPPRLRDIFAEFTTEITDYLLIGSNIFIKNHSKDFSYDWDSVLLGIRKRDLNKKNPPVYINYHYHNNGAIWHKFCKSLSEFLFTVLYDSLFGMDNKTAVKDKKMFSSPLRLFTMQDFIEVLSSDFIYTGHERITKKSDDRIVITV